MRLRLILSLSSLLAAAMLTTSPAVAADAPAAAGSAQPRARKKATKPTVAKRKKAKPAKSDGAEDSSGRAKMLAQKPARTLRPQPLRVLGDGDFHEINAEAQVTPFPSQASAVKKAFAANRRDQLKDAETSARQPDEKDRWPTVLFHLRELDSRTDGEACFWRVVAFYRLGELARARRIRDSCTLSTKDETSLDAEDALSASLQPVAALPELAAGEAPPTPVPNPAPYAGPAPARFERY